MNPNEPSLAALPNPLLRYLMATRPAFLTVTLFGCLVGLACAWAGGVALRADTALVGVLFALIAHAGVNVINDYHDSRNGADAANTGRLFPFTGGSRFIQNGVLSEAQIGRFGYLLLALVVPAGLWLTARSEAGLIWIGLAGLAVGWAYSAPPLELMSRGLGEFAVAAGWLLVVVGMDFVQRQSFAFAPVAAGLGYALLVANVLFINQFPDARADAAAGKRTLVVQLGSRRARWGYVGIAALAYGWLALHALAGKLPLGALLALATLPLSARAASGLLRDADRPQQLASAIVATIAAANLHGLLLAIGLVASRWVS